MPRINKRRFEKPTGLTVQALIFRTLLENVLKRLTCEIGMMSEEHKKKSGAAWKAQGRREIK